VPFPLDRQRKPGQSFHDVIGVSDPVQVWRRQERNWTRSISALRKAITKPTAVGRSKVTSLQDRLVSDVRLRCWCCWPRLLSSY